MPLPRVLFLHSNADDFLADSLLHGLRSLLGERLVDFPRRDAMYADMPPERLRGDTYGRGFTLYGRLPEIDVDRRWWVERALEGHYDAIVFAHLARDWGPWCRLRPELGRLRAKNVTLAGLDGLDGPPLYPRGPTWWRRARPLPPPGALGRMHVFKREITPATAWLHYFGVVPPAIGERLLARRLRPISFSIPEELLATGDEPKTKLLATHVVDPEVAAIAPGSRTGYAFEEEADYYADLRASRFGITTKKAGWDCLRHYELAASGCVPCFRDLHAKPARCAPHGLHEGNCVPYTDARELLERIEAMPSDTYDRLRAGALGWARGNTTRARALGFLAAIGHPVGDTRPAAVPDPATA